MNALNFSLPLPKFLNPCQSATTPAHSHVSPPGLSKEAPSPLAKVVPHHCQCSYHCCPRSPSRSLRSPALAPRKKISCSHQTPRHNGKVERSHRKDQERFYYKRVFVSFEDFKEKLRHWMREYNNFPMKPLNWKSPNEKFLEFQTL